MKVKIDTKEKMHVITVQEEILTANMTEAIENTLLPYLQQTVSNLVINLEQVSKIEEQAAISLVKVQQQFYDTEQSLVICALQRQVEQFLEKTELLEVMNVTPTESEARDIVQMEEIERELL